MFNVFAHAIIIGHYFIMNFTFFEIVPELKVVNPELYHSWSNFMTTFLLFIPVTRKDIPIIDRATPPAIFT